MSTIQSPKCSNYRCDKPRTHRHVDGRFLCDTHGSPPDQRSVIALILNNDGRIVVVPRHGDPNNLGFPGGKVELTDVDDWAALQRELTEEIGFKALSMVPIMTTDLGRSVTLFICSAREKDLDYLSTSSFSSNPNAARLVEPQELCTNACEYNEYNTFRLFTLGLVDLQAMPYD